MSNSGQLTDIKIQYTVILKPGVVFEINNYLSNMLNNAKSGPIKS